MIRALISLCLALAVSGCISLPEHAPADRSDLHLPGGLPAMAEFRARRAAPPSRPNAQMVQDFLDLAFRMESGRELPVFSRFEGPITVTVAPGAPGTLTHDLDRLLARLRTEAGIEIARIPRGPASITIETLPRARMQRVVPHAACFVVPRVSSWSEFRRARNTALLDWTTLAERERVAVFIPSDVPPQEIRDCLHEEIGQAIGPLNDLYRLPDSVFNDDNFHAVLTGFDMLILRAYYDPALHSGQPRAQVAAALPGLFARLNPRGERPSGGIVESTPRAWVDLIETALGRGTSGPRRLEAAQQALAYAEARGWTDTRLGFSYFAIGRLSLGQRGTGAIDAFRAAGAVFDRIEPGGIHAAHVNMQLAAFSLSAGDPQAALDLSGAALPAAMREENASLLATLLMIRAEALEALGRRQEARTVRMDSLAWARYGFGTTEAVTARLTEIAALAP
ncbi:DUF2927 domain-containing protein [Rhodobacterales bacterium HKCCE2091]|nr:DUF2927 domain-containing protein [Rhodobacterales bacterium HKCCE2091]